MFFFFFVYNLADTEKRKKNSNFIKNDNDRAMNMELSFYILFDRKEKKMITNKMLDEDDDGDDENDDDDDLCLHPTYRT